MRTALASTLLLAATLLPSTLHAEDVCSAASFKGAFGYSLKGFYYDKNYNIYFLGAVGRLVSDGAGAITGTDAISYDGTAVKRKYTGTYAVNEDCTGTLVLNADNTSVTNAEFVIVNDGKEVSLVQTDPGIIMTGDLKLQKTTPQVSTPLPTPSTLVQ
jgi:hypothetical protein